MAKPKPSRADGNRNGHGLDYEKIYDGPEVRSDGFDVSKERQLQRKCCDVDGENYPDVKPDVDAPVEEELGIQGAGPVDAQGAVHNGRVWVRVKARAWLWDESMARVASHTALTSSCGTTASL
jgi:hypothetical protein